VINFIFSNYNLSSGIKQGWDKITIIKLILLLSLIFLIGISMTSGLQLTVSTGNNDVSSAIGMVYGAETTDMIGQKIKANANQGTLSNHAEGTGSLPYSSISSSDINGNKAGVYRSIYGKPRVTSWNYEWNTYIPYSSSAGNGKGAQLWLNAYNAYTIKGGSYSSNKEGDSANVDTYVSSSYPYTKSSLGNYYTIATAFANEVGAYQRADYTSSGGATTVQGWANNLEKDYSKALINIPKGTINYPTTNVFAGKTGSRVYPTATEISTTGTGSLYAYASNLEGDSSNFNLKVTNGKVTNPNFNAWAGTVFAETWASIPNACGTTTEINTKALDKALGYQEDEHLRRKLTKVLRGEGDFAVKKTNNYAFSNVAVTTRAMKNDIKISTSGFGANTALILDPRRWEFVDYTGKDIRDSLMSSLKGKGYAVTYYSDSAVSKDKVRKMDEYKVSVINTHSSPTSLSLSKSSNGVTFDKMYPSELKTDYTEYNGMSLIIGCNSFKLTGSGTWAEAINKANVRGGTTDYWSIKYVRDFTKRFFVNMASGYSAIKANQNAKGLDYAYDANAKWTGGYTVKSLNLQGNGNFVL